MIYKIKIFFINFLINRKIIINLSINLNLSMVLMKLQNYKDAIGYLIEAKRLQPDNLKTLYNNLI